MAKDLVFYTNPMSRGRIVRWMLEEVGESYDTKIIPYEEIKSPDYLAVNPMGKVPALVHKGRTITECAAICAYLADVFPNAGLAPPPESRAAYYRWFFFAAGPLETAITNKTLNVVPNEEQRRTVGYDRMETVLDVLELAVQEAPYLAGNEFSAVDVYAGSQIGWGLQFGTIERRKSFEDYWARISSRPAKQKADEIDNALYQG
ncbi:glutathione S-transferase family protein [Henriciella pelagia]|jgi:glutathione S-transferase|uniref:Glutathione S-transferase n=1 Tax=Henriciella pelagia TaxID=1977912 RepID=A0ABQ1JPZ7_9PROT|nr:glutathione S-transferase family protein [Henriciella pelagia]GGB72180.1 glutathione S-transferase [Henriciella pelagia]